MSAEAEREISSHLRWMSRRNHLGHHVGLVSHLVRDGLSSALCSVGRPYRGRWVWDPDGVHCGNCTNMFCSGNYEGDVIDADPDREGAEP